MSSCLTSLCYVNIHAGKSRTLWGAIMVTELVLYSFCFTPKQFITSDWLIYLLFYLSFRGIGFVLHKTLLFKHESHLIPSDIRIIGCSCTTLYSLHLLIDVKAELYNTYRCERRCELCANQNFEVRHYKCVMIWLQLQVKKALSERV